MLKYTFSSSAKTTNKLALTPSFLSKTTVSFFNRGEQKKNKRKKKTNCTSLVLENVSFHNDKSFVPNSNNDDFSMACYSKHNRRLTTTTTTMSGQPVTRMMERTRSETEGSQK